MDLKNTFVLVFLVGSIIQFLLNHFLEFVDFKYRQKNGRKIPNELIGHVDSEILDKTCKYEDAKYKFWVPENIISFIFSLVLLFSGFYPYIFETIWSLTQRSFVTIFLFIIISGIPNSILSLPFSLYKEFKLEKKFGFSTMTVKLWIIDQIKNFVVSMIILLPLLLAMVFLLEKATNWWWVLLGGIYLVFSIGISLIYPAFIAPLFNKFSPLEDGELKDRLNNILEKTGFKSSGVFIMDASKRSKHSNAYFTGFGKTKRVVLYDTLVEQLTPAEIESVLAHELGHYKHHHIIKRMCFMIPSIFIVLFLANLFINNVDLYSGFGFDVSKGVISPMRFIGLFLLGIIFRSYTDLISPVSNYFSRRDEFQADKFAKNLCGNGKDLTTALIKLNKENLSEMVPPKIYSIFNYSHPPLLERIQALK